MQLYETFVVSFDQKSEILDEIEEKIDLVEFGNGNVGYKKVYASSTTLIPYLFYSYNKAMPM